MDFLIVVDMQNDFVDGALGTKEAMAIVPRVVDKIKNFQGRVLYTMDTHGEDYMNTQEGKSLPVKHCVKDTRGWELYPPVALLCKEEAIEKQTFGSVKLGQILFAENEREKIDSITLIGLCTDICVISNALLIKSFLPEVPVIVDESCCAGVTINSHKGALEAMKMCQIEIRQ
ncbi:MAG: isochorismatase family cysteine hydrolase [Acetivibrio sp.]